MPACRILDASHLPQHCAKTIQVGFEGSHRESLKDCSTFQLTLRGGLVDDYPAKMQILGR